MLHLDGNIYEAQNNTGDRPLCSLKERIYMNPKNKIIAKNVFQIFKTQPKVFKYGNDDNTKTVDIVICDNSPYDSVSSYSTIGLYNTNIGLSSNDKPIRTELLGACDMQIEEFENIISTAAFEIMDRQCAYPGFVIDNIVSMYIGNSDMKHLLLTYPFLWDNTDSMSFDDFTLAFLMLITISEREKEYCNENGLDALETIFEEYQIDVFDIYRKSVL